jgi:TPR repeat protein
MGEGVPQNSEHAFALYTRGCDGGDLFGCSKLGELFLDGAHVPQAETDRVRGLELLRLACEGGRQRACDRLADETAQ